MNLTHETDECALIDQECAEVSFEEARDAYSSRKYWVTFFVRPCCPPPSGEVAKVQLEKQRNLVRAREDFSDEQKNELIALIDKGEAWYRSTPYWRKA